MSSHPCRAPGGHDSCCGEPSATQDTTDISFLMVANMIAVREAEMRVWSVVTNTRYDGTCGLGVRVGLTSG